MKSISLFLVFILLTCLYCQTTIAQELPADSTTAEYKLAMQRKIFPQEKVHVMTDAELYMPGDSVWMRVWVQDGITLRDSKIGSNFVYADLCDARNVRQQIVKFKMREGKFYGYLPLPKDLQSGHYTLTVYTHYQHLMPDEYLCKRHIHVITRHHLRSGHTVRPLYEHQLATAEPLASSDIIYNRLKRSDTLQHVTFQAPANTWYAISVTDDMITPVDSANSITNSLPAVPDFFTLQSVAEDSNYYQPKAFPEVGGVAAGKIQTLRKLKPEEYQKLDVTIVNLKTQKVYFTKPNEKGEFFVSGVDIPNDSFINYSVFRNGTRVYNVEPYILLIKDSLHHIETGKDRYFVSRDREQLRKMGIDTYNFDAELLLLKTLAEEDSSDSIRLLKETEVILNEKKELELQLDNIVKKPFFIDDIYTRSATRTIMYQDIRHSKKKPLVADMACQFKKEGLSITPGEGLYYTNPKGKKLPVRIVVGTKEWPLTFNADSTLALNDALRIPAEVVYAIDYIQPSTAQQIDRNLTYPDSPILHIDLLNSYEGQNRQELRNLSGSLVLGYQKPLQHRNNQISKRMLHTRYWNPAVCSGTSGQISIDLPLPKNYHTTYTLRAEGITPDGQLVSINKRITL